MLLVYILEISCPIASGILWLPGKWTHPSPLSFRGLNFLLLYTTASDPGF